jgi:hypothetical protein
MDGQTARDLETSLLRELRTRGAVFANKQRSQKFDGWSESWVQGSYRVSLLSELLSVLY